MKVLNKAQIFQPIRLIKIVALQNGIMRPKQNALEYTRIGCTHKPKNTNPKFLNIHSFACYELIRIS